MRRVLSTLALLVIVATLLSTVAVTSVNARPLDSNPTTSNLVSWWALSETSGTRNDSHGTNHLTDNNTVLYSASGIKTNAADFERDNSESLSITSNASLVTGDIDFTLFAWVKAETLTDFQTVVSKRSGTTPNEYQIYYQSSAFSFSIQDSSNITSLVTATTPSISTNTWYFIVAWHNASANTLNIQVNDGTVYSNTSPVTPRTSTSLFQIGAQQSPAAGFWDGLIDEAGLYKRVLTSAERTWLYNAGAGRSYCEISLTCATPEPTSTFTVTSTFTSTNTATFTPTHTATETYTPTITETHTPGPTSTYTDTPTPTDTATNTATFTPTATLSPTPSRTPGTPVMPTWYIEPQITYGEYMNVIVLAGLCLVIILVFFVLFIVLNTKRK